MQTAMSRLLPAPLYELLRRAKRTIEKRRNASRSVEDVFTDIYLNRKWGGAPDQFCSGSGTTNQRVVDAYVQAVAEWCGRHAASDLSAVDLGCGDFVVGRKIAPLFRNYIGADVVRPLIEHHNRLHSSDTVTFRQCNIIEDVLPEGDVCFVRQVLQHLDNAEILTILGKLARYRWVIVTEHVPSPGQLKAPNLDKPHGSDIRLTAGSGVYLDQPPFCLPSTRIEVVLEVPWLGAHGEDEGILRTVVLNAES